MKRSTDVRSRQAEKGQVLVVVALLMVAMVGMLGLTLDGGRIYVDRRVMQNAADVAALGAADAYAGWLEDHAGDTSGAQRASCAAGVTEFQNETGSGTMSSDSGAAIGDCTSGTISKYAAGAYRLTLTLLSAPNAADPTNGRVFRACGTHGLGTFFIQVLNQVSNYTIAAEAQAITAQSIPTPGAVLFLLDPSSASGPTPCGSGNGDSYTAGGGSFLAVNGSIVSDGDLTDSNNAGLSVYDNGKVLDHCDATLPFTGKVCWYTTAIPTPTPKCAASTGTARFSGHQGPFADPLGPTRLNWAASTNYFAGAYLAPYTSTSPTYTNFGSTKPVE